MEDESMHDRSVTIASPARLTVGLALAALVAVAAVPSPVRACVLMRPGIRGRVVWPGAGQQPPVNTRLVVSYQATSYPDIGSVPPFGPDIELRGADGQPVAITTETVGNDVVVRPDAPLLQAHDYQLFDRQAVPCDALQNQCTLLAAAQPLASFTTAADTDTTPPRFDGLASVTVLRHDVCDADACCGPYDSFIVSLGWPPATDDRQGLEVRYNVYRRSDQGAPALTLVAGFMSTTMLNGSVACGSSAGPFTPILQPGRYVVRAVDAAGNEDANTTEQTLGDACAQSRTGWGCDVAGDRGPAAGVAGLAGLVAFTALAARRRRRAHAGQHAPWRR
jgi:MYXO-CTERM domain-containing protein